MIDFDAAIRKHSEWKFRFQEAVFQGKQLDDAAIGRDNQCELGKWLHGDAKAAYGASPSYAKCRNAHAAFHTEAGKVAVAVNGGRRDAVKEMLGPASAFAEASKVVSVALIELKNTKK